MGWNSFRSGIAFLCNRKKYPPLVKHKLRFRDQADIHSHDSNLAFCHGVSAAYHSSGTYRKPAPGQYCPALPQGQSKRRHCLKSRFSYLSQGQSIQQPLLQSPQRKKENSSFYNSSCSLHTIRSPVHFPYGHAVYANTIFSPAHRWCAAACGPDGRPAGPSSPGIPPGPPDFHGCGA